MRRQPEADVWPELARALWGNYMPSSPSKVFYAFNRFLVWSLNIDWFKLWSSSKHDVTNIMFFLDSICGIHSTKDAEIAYYFRVPLRNGI